MRKKWYIIKTCSDMIGQLKNELGCNSTIAKLLINRKMTSSIKATTFLNPALTSLSQHHKLSGIKKAVSRITTAIIKKEKIMIFGDYDVDGVTATTAFISFLRYTGANVNYHIPHRINEGYDLKSDFIINKAIPDKYTLIITVDCGSKSNEAITKAKSAGIDTIITDHHNILNSPKHAFSCINPNAKHHLSGLSYSTGIGVVFHILVALRKYLRNKGYWKNKKEPNLLYYCDLVALGTISDIAPLIKENRIITNIGLKLINQTPRLGIKTLIQKNKILNKTIDTEILAFNLSPKLNAAGRIGNANISCELLLTQNKEIANYLTNKLYYLNSKRQNKERSLIKKISNFLNLNKNFLKKESILLEGKKWHLGILGIAASRLSKELNKPIILTSSNKKISKGSARSINGINIINALAKSSKWLKKFGGHPLAAGLTLKSKNIYNFNKKLEFIINIATKKKLSNILPIDDQIKINKITPKFMNSLESLGPFGENNPTPIFVDKNIQILIPKIIGKKHCKMLLKAQNQTNTYSAIKFGIDINSTIPKKCKKIIYRPKWNEWKNKREIQIIIEDINPDVNIHDKT